MISLIRIVTAVFILTLGSVQAKPAREAQPPDLQSLTHALEGDWALKVHFEPGPHSPNGLDGNGEETWRSTAGDLTLVDEESISAGPMQIIIMGLFWSDQKTHELHALDCSNQNSKVCGLQDAIDGVTVHWDGKELVVQENEAGPNGQPMISRIVWSNITPTSFTETGYLGPPGGPFKMGMTVTARKKRTLRLNAK
jgi:hypothetical protein